MAEQRVSRVGKAVQTGSGARFHGNCTGCGEGKDASARWYLGKSCRWSPEGYSLGREPPRVKLMIVESPNKIKKIKGILGSGWEVAASVGHIRDLPVKDLGLAMPGYVPEYELSERGADVVRRLRGLVGRAEGVYLATDPDREGEAIAWHLSEALRLKKALRVSFDAITTEVVRRAVAAPRSIDLHLVRAQEARRVLDRLVGYQISPVLGKGLSAGRVQSPAVRLVVDREREIEAFVEVRHFGAELMFEGWRAQWEPVLPKGEKYCLDEVLAGRAASCRECAVSASSNRITKQPPPPPFSTSTMLQAASVRLKWKPDMTAGVAQKLFEAGLITYHRTDSVNFSAEALREVREFAAGRGLPLPSQARHFKSKGGAQEAHEAIRPTHFASEQAGEDGSQRALYRLIWERAVASQLADAEWSVNTTRLSASLGAETFAFKAEGRVLVIPGWKALTGRDAAEEDDEPEGDGRVPVLAVGAEARALDGRVLHKKTEPPVRYTQATLIKKLEGMGIGRPSTYPAILKNVQTRGYLEDEGKYLRPSMLGFSIIDALVGRFSFVEYAFTRELEEQLDRIAEAKTEYLPVVSAADARLQGEIAALRPAPAPVRAGFRAGAARGSSAPVSSDEPSRVGSAAFAKSASRASGARWTPPQGGFIASRTRLNGDFVPSAEDRVTGSTPPRVPAAPRVGMERTKTQAGRETRAAKKRGTGASDGSPEAKPARKKPATKASGAARTAAVRNSAEKSGKEEPIPCPVCKVGFVRLPHEDAKAWGCSQWGESKCPLTIWRNMAGREIRDAEVRALCTKGRTGVLFGFKSKAGNGFKAALVLKAEGKAEFEFGPR